MNTSLLRRVIITIALAAIVSMLTSPVAAAPTVDYDPARLANTTIAERLVADVFNAEDADAAARLVSDTAVIHTQLGDFAGPEGLLSYIGALKHTYPGATFSILHVTTSGDGVALDWLMTSTKIRMATTGQIASVNVELRGTTSIATSDGQIAEVTFDPGIAALPDTAGYMPGSGQPF